MAPVLDLEGVVEVVRIVEQPGKNIAVTFFDVLGVKNDGRKLLLVPNKNQPLQIGRDYLK